MMVLFIMTLLTLLIIGAVYFSQNNKTPLPPPPVSTLIPEPVKQTVTKPADRIM